MTNFYIGNEKIDIVQNCTYLGTRISSTGNFTLSLKHFREKWLMLCLAIRRHIDKGTKLFSHTLVMSIDLHSNGKTSFKMPIL